MKTGNKVHTDISSFRSSMFRVVKDLCKKKKVSGAVLTQLLKEVSEDVYTVGIDRAFKKTKMVDIDNLADAFDLVWLSPLAIRIYNLKNKR